MLLNDLITYRNRAKSPAAAAEGPAEEALPLPPDDTDGEAAEAKPEPAADNDSEKEPQETE